MALQGADQRHALPGCGRGIRHDMRRKGAAGNPERRGKKEMGRPAAIGETTIFSSPRAEAGPIATAISSSRLAII